MKKVSFLVFAVLILSVSRITAQGLHLGIKGGTDVTDLTGRSFNSSTAANIVAGAFAEINISGKWGVQPEVLFSQVSSQTASDFNVTYNPYGIPNRGFKLNYINIPVLLTYKLPIPILSLQLGPQFGILMNSTQNITTNGTNAFKTSNFSVVGGAQVNLGGFKAGARYIYGLTNIAAIDQISAVDTWETRTIEIYIGLRIF